MTTLENRDSDQADHGIDSRALPVVDSAYEDDACEDLETDNCDISDDGQNDCITDNFTAKRSSVPGKIRLNRRQEKRSKDINSDERDVLRLRINMRERQRMHDINSALDGLRQVMPYGHGPSVKKLSKMATLLLAKNYIITLTRSLEEMKKLVCEMQQRSHSFQKMSPRSPPSIVLMPSAVDSGSQPVSRELFQPRATFPPALAMNFTVGRLPAVHIPPCPCACQHCTTATETAGDLSPGKQRN
ncbi:oligodendrocyte transcription factor 2-like [Lingula anatina]|uniref:Oligodendrocyte transcription factor 2-like n=1 Tax=Lingula anatina TaxID=7574 RepID=A0A1S3IQC9_LINAN|nr:oligodendrocyte transcription factor 2-like [Lingula anatina]|eukprot:XP_013399744.1 oligodendrocyte transcription factor 2-like [Lingula anatina]